MSELTRCNWHKVQDMKRRAEARGVELVIENGTGGWTGWVTVRYSDEQGPSAYFMELTETCAC